MRYKEKRRCSPTDFYSVGAERGRPWTEVRRAWSYMRRQERDCVHQSCAAVPSAYLAVGQDVRGFHHDGMPDLLRGVGGRGRSGSIERQVVAVVWAATRVIIFTL